VADVKQAEGTCEVAKTYLDWTIIRSPVNGVVMEKLVNANELVVPQASAADVAPALRC